MNWEEAEHPRRPDGRFRDKSGRWAQTLLDQLGYGGLDILEQQVRTGTETENHPFMQQGVQARVSIVELKMPDGSTKTTIQKLYEREFLGTESAGEAMASLIGLAVGAPVPAVVLDEHNPDLLHMDYLPGVAPFRKATEQERDGPDGRLLGLLDLLVNNKDRNGSNWLVLEDGSIAGIDHGVVDLNRESVDTSEENQRWPHNDFTSHYLRRRVGLATGGPLAENDWHPDDLAEVERRLRVLFESERYKRLKEPAHSDEYLILERLAAIRALARGTVRRLT